MKRRDQIILIVSFLGFSWLAMQAVHEFGHALGAWLTGGKVQHLVLHPLAFSRTDVDPNPHPLFVAWAGPVVGAILPLLAFLLARALRLPAVYLYRFFAGFCLIANGAYIACGSFQGLADAGEMLRYGSAKWQLICFGVLTASLGVYLWNGLGPMFGLGAAQGEVNRSHSRASVGLFLMISIVELLSARKAFC